ncbi:chemotaxis MotB protein [Primorskyibacter flagellatus]|uniref:Chemotaxis MotB protein n=1 Tax=Primorskyibacter flagellatus TaxID=1387277 RepID=A0A917EIE8_9RHOB|nr:flagellar motor protein MotB [Primorskyibacter flagellatus]GGE38418.1 chemotaxis MotB protein [Primorskyibacter flagellatus]
MSTQANAAPIIIKRKKVVAGGGHHGGAWKVAYADFVTAMMAFFLLMWLLNATTEKQRKGIADFFSPTIPVNRISGGGEGAFGGESVFTEQTLARNGIGATALQASDERRSRGQGGTGAQEQQEKVEEMLRGLTGESEVAPEMTKHIITRVTDEGLVIEIFDRPGAPLFQDDSDRPTPLLKAIAAMLVRVTAIVSNPVAVEAHVASRPVVVATNPVWGLSSARADAARKLLDDSGMAAGRVIRVTGHADREPAARNPMAPRNNRIELILVRDRT